MGFIKAFAGALGGTFADQWLDYYMPEQGVSPTAGLFQAVQQGTNNGRGENTKGSANVITNGSKFVVPEGTALITVQDGAVTGFIAEPGGYVYSSDDPNSKSMFSGGGILASTIGSSWEKFKFGSVRTITSCQPWAALHRTWSGTASGPARPGYPECRG